MSGASFTEVNLLLLRSRPMYLVDFKVIWSALTDVIEFKINDK